MTWIRGDGDGEAVRQFLETTHGFCSILRCKSSCSILALGSASIMFAIGQALQGHVNATERTIFNSSNSFASRIVPANQAIAFYEAQIKATTAAMRSWTHVGIKLKVVKDVRKLISKLIWGSRDEALYDVSEGEEEQAEEQEQQEQQEPQPSARALRAQKRARK
jgi:hypothetical protein